MATSLEDLRILQLAEGIADEVWSVTLKWDAYAKQVVGKQMTRATDSIGANIAEAFGRYHYGEKIRFLYFARGSLFEAKYWLNRASSRQLIPAADAQECAAALNSLARQLNAFVNALKAQKQEAADRPSAVREGVLNYETPGEMTERPFFDDTELHWLS